MFDFIVRCFKGVVKVVLLYAVIVVMVKWHGSVIDVYDADVVVKRNEVIMKIEGFEKGLFDDMGEYRLLLCKLALYTGMLCLLYLPYGLIGIVVLYLEIVKEDY